jgi:hypothetical protein
MSSGGLFVHIVLFATGFLAGVLNSVLGGGSFISFPALIFAGVPPVRANATNALAQWTSGLTSAAGYARDIDVPPRTAGVLIACSSLGAVAGALLLLYTPESRFLDLVPWLLLTATLIFTFGKRIAALNPSKPRSLAFASTLQVGIAVYGGYFGGGMGILMLASFAMMGMPGIHAMNGLRSILGAAINGVAVVAFVIAGAIEWGPAILMAIASSLGGYLGARIARRIRPEVVKRFVLVLAWAMTAWFMLDAYR